MMDMNIYIFPSNPYRNNGYSIAVKSDLSRLTVNPEDLIVWYENTNETFFGNDVVLPRPSRFAISRAIKVLQNRVNCEVTARDLKKLNLEQADSIFCGEVIFYRALRELFPSKRIVVRFHNCFARILDRIQLIDKKLNLKFRIQLRAYYQLEKAIFQDDNVYKIFISEEDRDYYCSMFGKYSDSEVWGFMPDMKKAASNRIDSKKTKLIHFGGLQSHKIDSMKWFINDVFKPLHIKNPSVEFHLWGAGTDSFNFPEEGVFGHGFYKGNELPFVKDGLYVNPDLVGGGVKIKLMDYFEKGASFITTPYGYEGYPLEYIDDKFYHRIEPEQWLAFLDNYFA